MRDTAVAEGKLKSGTTVGGRQFGNCSWNGSETEAKESGWIPKQGASVRREPWKFKMHMTAHHPLADLPSWHSFHALLSSGVSSPPTHGPPKCQYSVFPGLPQTLDLTSCPRCLRGKERTPGLKWWPLLGFCIADWRFCLESRSFYCFTSFKGTSPRHALFSLTAVRWASLSFTFLPQKVFDFSSVECLVIQKDRKIAPLRQETSQSLSVNLGAWFGEVWYSSSSSSSWARTKNKTSSKQTQD